MAIRIPISIANVAQVAAQLDALYAKVQRLKSAGSGSPSSGSSRGSYAGINAKGDPIAPPPVWKQQYDAFRSARALQNAGSGSSGATSQAAQIAQQYLVQQVQSGNARAVPALNSVNRYLSTQGGGMGAGSGMLRGVTSLLSKAGPIGIAVALAVAGIAFWSVTIARAMRDSVRYIRTATSQVHAGGGVFGSLGAMSSLYGDAGSKARQFQAGIESGAGAAYAAEAGINIIGGPYGDMDYAAKLKKYSERIARAKDYNEARKMAEAVGMPELAGNYYLKEGTKKYLYDGQRSGVSPRQAQSGQEAEFWNQEFNRQKDQLKARLSKPLIDAKSKFDEANAKILDWVNKKLSGGSEVSKPSSAKTQRDALERNSNELQLNTRAMNQLRATLGGGPRAEGAIPSRLGVNVRRLDYREAISSGVL